MKPKTKPGIFALKQKRRNRPISIAHRGASAWANENTLRVFNTANNLWLKCGRLMFIFHMMVYV
ncbi:MAG: hypothetical protein CM1200mP30_22190 [Pseudomonadota bacterium]|nr:MAG: hypothetical protein CM1200mP30_22190 [Pseudomonadota bacterium]